MLTGDKRETAEQIARSCGIIKPNTMLYRLTVEHVQDNFVTLQ